MGQHCSSDFRAPSKLFTDLATSADAPHALIIRPKNFQATMLNDKNLMCIPMTTEQKPMSPPTVHTSLASNSDDVKAVSPSSQLTKPVRPLTAYRECGIIYHDVEMPFTFMLCVKMLFG